MGLLDKARTTQVPQAKKKRYPMNHVTLQVI